MNRIDEGRKNFEGGLTAKKYTAMTKTSIATAKRDIQDLEKNGLIKQKHSQRGRWEREEPIFLTFDRFKKS